MKSDVSGLQVPKVMTREQRLEENSLTSADRKKDVLGQKWKAEPEAQINFSDLLKSEDRGQYIANINNNTGQTLVKGLKYVSLYYA